MIIWINGAFGSGKTSAAYELNRRISKSYVYDPEEVGFFIRDNIPKDLSLDDFQQFSMWREFNYKMLKYIYNKYSGIIIVPMTITDENYYNEIIEKLRKDNINLKHFVLMADKETLLKRLRKRGDGKNSWPAKQIDRCINNLNKKMFKEHIYTDEMTVEQVIEYISKACEIELLQDTRTWFGV
ncbi:AAA family ATPase [Clostridiaceae bacterium M8S5]|nr:AAA family ATPase [Clostridiaceae bacterium M8S5]